MPEAADQVDRILGEYRRLRVPATVSFVIGVPIVVLTIVWWHRDPTDGRGMVATVIASAEFTAALFTVSSWVLTTRARLIRVHRITTRFGVYHDPSPTRVCPRCGLPMDRAMGGAFYTGPTSPLELCHRCLHADEPSGHDWPS